MAIELRAPRLAVLIDADNASARIAAGLFEEIAKIGEASLRRIYGDFSGTRLKSWVDVLQTHAIMAHQSFAYTTGKNASDIALVIDAMDLLHDGRFDGFCLVSSDSDFTRLAARLREGGADVYGFGEQKTPASFRQACSRFIYTEHLLPTASKPSETERQDAPADRAGDKPAPPTVKLPAIDAIALIRTAIQQVEDENGWVKLGRIGQQLAKLKSDFDPRNYGNAKLIDLVKKTDAFDVQQNDQSVYVRERTAPAPARSAATKTATVAKPAAAVKAAAASATKPAATATAKPAAARK